MNLPPEFISTIKNTFREEGHAFLGELPDMIAEASERWGLTDVQPVPSLSYNFVAFANSPSPVGRGMSAKSPKGEGQGEGGKVVLKMCVPNREARSEMAALRLFNGEGACRLLDYDEGRCWMLLERLKPGVMLSTMEDDEESTRIAAEVMRKIWRNSLDTSREPRDYSTIGSKFILLTDWFLGGFERMRKKFNGGTGPLDAKLVERTERSVKDFFAENHRPALIHGDFHHYNVLSSERGWLVIDPKGVFGPAGYEVGPFMMNPRGSFSDGVSHRLILRRIDILREHLGFERERILEWSLAHAVLSAWWSIEDREDWQFAEEFAKMIALI